MLIGEIYNQVTTLWERIRADALSHLWLAAILFFFGYRFNVAGVTLPNPSTISNDEWFKLADKFGIGLITAVAIVSIIAAYTLFIRFIGDILFNIIINLFGGWGYSDYEFLKNNRDVLEAILATLPEADRNGHKAVEQLNKLAIRYRNLNSERFREVDQNLGNLNRSSYAYARNFTLFAVFWIIIWFFNPLLPNQIGVIGNHPFAVAVALGFAAWIAYRRLENFNKLSRWRWGEVVRDCIIADQTVAWPKAEVDTWEVRSKVVSELSETLITSYQPKLRTYIRYNLFPEHLKLGTISTVWQSHKDVLRRGEEFSRSEHRLEYKDPNWLSNYMEFLYWSIISSIKSIGRVLRSVLFMG